MINSSGLIIFSTIIKETVDLRCLRGRAIIEKLYNMAVVNEIEASTDRFHALTA